MGKVYPLRVRKPFGYTFVTSRHPRNMRFPIKKSFYRRPGFEEQAIF